MEIIQFMIDYGVDNLVIALCTVVLTGLFKMPIKMLAEKTKDSKKITRFLTFLPILIGFGLTALFVYLFTGTITFNREFFVKWLTSVSASLTMYAFWEKFVPSEKKILAKEEIEANKLIVETLKNNLLQDTEDSKVEDESEELNSIMDISAKLKEQVAANNKKHI